MKMQECFNSDKDPGFFNWARRESEDEDTEDGNWGEEDEEEPIDIPRIFRMMMMMMMETMTEDMMIMAKVAKVILIGGEGLMFEMENIEVKSQRVEHRRPVDERDDALENLTFEVSNSTRKPSVVLRERELAVHGKNTSMGSSS